MTNLKYDEIYGLHCMITLQSGREINLRRLDQRQTYWGLLLGSPTKRSNVWTIEEALEEAGRLSDYPQGTPFLIQPRRQLDESESGDSGASEKGDRTLEWLPRVRCIGMFDSIPAARDQVKDASGLTLVWFQDEFALPIHDEVLEAIRGIDWNLIATDFDLD